jgi:outer membrane immunogenic protein
MKRIQFVFSASIAGVGVFGSQALAAETPSDRWTGYYGGVNAAYNFSDSRNTKYGKWGGEGWGGGVQAGYTQSYGRIVFGGELDLSYNDVDGNSDPVFGGKKLRSGFDWAGAARVKAGLPLGEVPLVNDVLIYGTGGLAVASWTAEHDNGSGTFTEATRTRFGWVGGAGVEFPVCTDMSVKVEYLYTDYLDQLFGVDGGQRLDDKVQTVRVGLNWRL